MIGGVVAPALLVLPAARFSFSTGMKIATVAVNVPLGVACIGLMLRRFRGRRRLERERTEAATER